MFVAVLARRLKPGKSYEDFLEAWYPDKGFDVPGRGPILARNIADDREILAISLLDLSDRADVQTVLERVAAQEAVRHDRIEAVIETTSLRGLYEMTDEFDFSTDAGVAAGRARLPESR